MIKLDRIAALYGWKPAAKRARVKKRQLRLFLAHAKEDKAIVREIFKRLSDLGFDPWLDEVKLLPGQTWRSEISKAIRNSDAFLACLSKTAVSKVGYLNREFKEALEVADEQPEGKIFIIPVRLEQCEVPDRFRDIQWVDYFKPSGFTLLLESLRALARWLGQPETGANLDNPTLSIASKSSASKEARILQGEKTAAENLTRLAVELIKENRMPEVRQLYKARWNELATLRTNIAFDGELSAAEKQNIDWALRSDQEGITDVLGKYDQVYEP